MSDVLINTDKEEKPKADNLAAFSPKMQELSDALALLYIDGNASGRNKFRDVWPDVALYLFGATLIEYDNQGPADWDLRKTLEDEANQRRILLRNTIDELLVRSVEAGMLNFEYVGEVIDQFGSDLSQYLYAPDIIERVRPGALATTQSSKDVQAQSDQDDVDRDDEAKRAYSAESAKENRPPSSPEETALSSEEKAILSNSMDDDVQSIEAPEQDIASAPDDILSESFGDPMDDIKPIETVSAKPVKMSPLPMEDKVEQSVDLDDIHPIDMPATAEEKMVLPDKEPTDSIDDVKPIETNSIAPSLPQEPLRTSSDLEEPSQEEEIDRKPAPSITDQAEPEDIIEEPVTQRVEYKALFNSVAMVKVA